MQPVVQSYLYLLTHGLALEFKQLRCIQGGEAYRDSLDSDSSALAGFTGKERAVDRIRRDVRERKKEFLESQTYPAYLSSPPKDIDKNPRGIANLATTMPPPEMKEMEPEPPKTAKNIFMDIYAQEMSKMQTSAKSSAQSKKRNFDASQFNAYGLPLGELTQ